MTGGTDFRAREAAARAFWQNVETFLERYIKSYTPSSWSCFKNREGCYLLFLTVGLIAVEWLTFWAPSLIGGILSLFVCFVGIDILVFNTTAVFVTGQPLSPLRSAVLTIWAYLNLALAFAVLWVWIMSIPPMEALYESLRTLSTSGPARPIQTVPARLLAITELLVGVYFLVLIFAIYASWARPWKSTR